MNTPHYDVLIVGAGHAGARAAAALRQGDFAGTIGVVGEETDPPYERPPLSKEYLSGERQLSRLWLRSEEFWSANRIEMLPGRRVEAVDPQRHTVTAQTGESFRYGVLIWAAGGVARKLRCPGADFAGVHTLRSRGDADRIAAELGASAQVVIIGGGYVGLEVAATLSALGKQVTILEALDRVLARVAGEPVSRFCEDYHRSRGIDVRLGVDVTEILGGGARVTGVQVAGGEVFPAQLVVVGIGIGPATTPLLEAGAAGENGVTVDGLCRTSLADVYAIGDCAAHANEFAGGGIVRLESIQNANDQAVTAAKAILGSTVPYRVVPWFWSNQFDLKFQTVGLSTGYDEHVIRRDPAGKGFSLIYLRAGRVIALDCVNATRDYTQGAALISAQKQIAPHRLADTSLSLKQTLSGGP